MEAVLRRVDVGLGGGVVPLLEEGGGAEAAEAGVVVYFGCEGEFGGKTFGPETRVAAEPGVVVGVICAGAIVWSALVLEVRAC